MIDLFIYAIQSAIALVLLYIPYTLLLSREKMFRFNRLTLLAILVLSLVLPLCNLSVLSLDHISAVQTIEQGMVEAGIPVERVQMDLESAPHQQFPWFYVVSWVYALGIVLVLLVRLVQFVRMGLVIHQGALWQHTEDGSTLYCHAGQVAPFSWLNSIVISQQDYEENGREIVLHERGHILSHHSWDILLLTIVQMVQWWNPVVYMLGLSLRDVHEYEADDYVLRQGVSARGYQMLLVTKAVRNSSYTFANSFSHSLTKRRLAMIQRTVASPWRRCRVLYVLPLALLALSAFATPRVMEPMQTALEWLKPAVEPIPAYTRYMKTYQALTDETGEVIPRVDRAPQFRGGKDNLLRCLYAHIYYPKSGVLNSLQGTVVMSFVVEKDGRVTDIKIPDDDFWYHFDRKEMKFVNDFYDAATNAVSHTTGRWLPAQLNGQPVRMRMYLPITFNLEEERHTSLFGTTRTTKKKCSFLFYI